MIKAKGIADNEDYIVLAKEDFEKLYKKANTNERHAHWEAKEEMIRHPYARNYYCSWCKFEPLEMGNYCPHCGAIMDEEEQK